MGSESFNSIAITLYKKGCSRMTGISYKYLKWGGWILSVAITIALIVFFSINWMAPEALTAVSVLGSMLIGIYSIFILSDPASRTTPLSNIILKLFLTATLILSIEAVRFIVHSGPLMSDRYLQVAYLWDDKTQELFPPDYVDHKNIKTYMNISDYWARSAIKHLEQYSKEENNIESMVFNTDMTELLLIDNLGRLFHNSWIVRQIELPSVLYGGKYSAISWDDNVNKNTLGAKQIEGLQDNWFINYLEKDFQLVVPPDVEVSIRRGIKTASERAGTEIFFDGRYCDLTIAIEGVTGTPRVDLGETINSAVVLVKLTSDCTPFLRGHPDTKSRRQWIKEITGSLLREFQYVDTARKK
ncbi:MAG: hypothetical protein BMS9Abin26_1737 [Gammaproteobacteria bacterium]|nr:MAG: hypothetical protein BMS9Abin26_1737 [Gammaproteobacteria bacterium]